MYGDVGTGRIGQLKCAVKGVQYALPYINSWRPFSSMMNKNIYDLGYNIWLSYIAGV